MFGTYARLPRLFVLFAFARAARSSSALPGGQAIERADHKQVQHTRWGPDRAPNDARGTPLGGKGEGGRMLTVGGRWPALSHPP